MKWKCPKCGDVMEGKTTYVHVLDRRYAVDCRCTEDFATGKEAKAFQAKHWKRRY